MQLTIFNFMVILWSTVEMEIKPLAHLQKVGNDGNPVEMRIGQMDH
jgi:hypothetical protein